VSGVVLNPVAVAPLPVAPDAALAPVSTVAVPGLPPPAADAELPSDPLGMLMALMARMANLSVDESTAKVMANRKKLHEAMDEFRAKMEEIARKAEEQKKEADDGWGILGDMCDAVCDFVGDAIGELLGPLVEHVVDVVRAPLDIIVGLVKGQNIVELLEQEVSDVKSEGKLSETVKEAAKGVAAFARDIVNAATGMLEDLAKGRDPLDALCDFGVDCYNSLINNVVDNPAVMEVVGTALQVVAVAGAVASGGILGPIAAGLILLSMADRATGMCNAVFGDEAGPWVSLGIGVAGAVLGGLVSADLSSVSDLLGDVQSALPVANAVLQGVAAYRGAQQMMRDAERIDDLADLQQLRNRMAEIQRMIDTLLGELEERSESRDRVMQGGAKVFQMQGECLEASVYLRA